MAETNLTVSIKLTDYCQTFIHQSFIGRRLVLVAFFQQLQYTVVDGAAQN